MEEILTELGLVGTQFTQSWEWRYRSREKRGRSSGVGIGNIELWGTYKVHMNNMIGTRVAYPSVVTNIISSQYNITVAVVI